MIELNIPKQAGWICPICGRVMAPTMVECIYCNKGIEKGTKPIDDVVTTAHNDGAPSTSTCKCNSKEKKEVKCNTHDAIDSVAMIKKIDEKGNLIDEKDMTEEELKKMESILEKVLGDLTNIL